MNLRLLSKYLFQFHVLPLPDLGVIILSRTSARLNMPDKIIAPASFRIEFRQELSATDHLLEWLSSELNTAMRDTAIALDAFVAKINDTLNAGGRFDWGEFGMLEKDDTGKVTLSGDVIIPAGYTSLTAEKLIKKNADHEVLVGDRVYSGADMKNRLTEKKNVTKKYRMQLSVILILVLLTATLITAIKSKDFFVKHQNQLQIQPMPAPTTYKILNSED